MVYMVVRDWRFYSPIYHTNNIVTVLIVIKIINNYYMKIRLNSYLMCESRYYVYNI